MSGLRWVATTIALPLVYIVVLYVATRPPKATYVFGTPTVMTVSDKDGPAVMHSPLPCIPRKRCTRGWKGRWS